MVAIAAVLGYNALLFGNKGVIAKLNRFAYHLHALFVTGSRVDSDSAKVLPIRKA
jgi:biopolymer transport protein ExbB